MKSTRSLFTAALLAGISLAGSAWAQDFNPDASIRIGSLYEPQNLDNTAGAGQGITRPLTATSMKPCSN